MDAFDVQILRMMQENNRLTCQNLADKIGLSASACNKRLQRLRRSGIIRADVSILDPVAVGRNLMLIVQVHLERERAEHLDRFKKKMFEAPEVIQCYYVTGASDFILIVSTRDMKEYEDFTRTYFIDCPNIAHFYTSVVMNRVKYTLSMPVEADVH